ncbi:hypothetical protein GTY67_21525 [Streptomyces sp. SID8374]|uniref:DUF5707 domain-containing protein n=1 Tax=Streptomyces sp. SID8374 TaxID=2690354 RepID=UPI001370D987|nr:DUF5707 domain-containing protein [Streptomyces sp. SID8374]MYX15938.1 hypothetical protein [Streptomyces sp. SID8374]
MSKRVVTISALAGVALLGGAGAYAFAGESGSNGSAGPEVTKASVAYVAPGKDKDGSLTFTARVADGSGVRNLKVLAWPASMAPAPDAGDMAHIESATCEPTGPSGDEAALCTYKVKVTTAEAAESPKGAWHVAVLASAKDGGKTFAPKAAGFTVKG